MFIAQMISAAIYRTSAMKDLFPILPLNSHFFKYTFRHKRVYGEELNDGKNPIIEITLNAQKQNIIMSLNNPA